MGPATLIAIGGGGLSAAISVAALSGSLAGATFAYFTPLPLLMVGLALGLAPAALASAVGVVIVSLFGGVTAAALYGGVHALPSWLVVRHSLQRQPAQAPGQGDWRPIGAVVCHLSVLAGILVALVLLLSSGVDGPEAAVKGLLDAALAVALPQIPEADRQTFVATLAPFFAGGCGATWQIMIMINAVLAQAFLTSRGRALRPTPKWSQIRLPDWMAWPLVAAAALALILPQDGAFIARNLALVFAVPYFILGLAVVHTLARRTGAKSLFLVAFYLLLALFFVGAAVAVAGLGLIEQWSGVRRRFPGQTHE